MKRRYYMTPAEYVVADVTVAEFRPVVVLDPEDSAQVARLLSGYYSGISGKRIAAEDSLVGDMQTALRSLLEPDRPEEPTGRYAVVEDSAGREWCRVDVSNGYAWQLLGQPDGQCRYDMWRNLAASRVLSEGVRDAD